MRVLLVALDGSGPVDLVKDLTLVGRKEQCDLRLEHKSVSKMHCVIVKTDGLLLVRDLGSTNGTRVNGQRVRRAALLPNDELTIACYKFRVQFGPEDGNPPANLLTQQLEPAEVAHLLRKVKPSEEGDQPANPAPEPLVPNALPDVYPEEDPKPSGVK